jgi:hypothetical protein
MGQLQIEEWSGFSCWHGQKIFLSANSQAGSEAVHVNYVRPAEKMNITFMVQSYSTYRQEKWWDNIISMTSLQELLTISLRLMLFVSSEAIRSDIVQYRLEEVHGNRSCHISQMRNFNAYQLLACLLYDQPLLWNILTQYKYCLPISYHKFLNWSFISEPLKSYFLLNKWMFLLCICLKNFYKIIVQTFGCFRYGYRKHY